ncbi:MULTISPECIES: GTPase [unclassified Coleofasciculus]|uniref:GTPase n=1 Tax=Cyanophyceae TaxID=3028117 RepID=UPI001685ED74|nr:MULTISPECIES: GTPase [unclassified Coleofasciculus]MBD2083762.1 50S ribosome-binding GTPase [Coleofasciculus sp. FACHB-542]MBD2539830.1 50S ribosome-binding GTPase [Coleofasciculus sp. FACHB-SPT36]
MVNAASDSWDERDFWENVETQFEEKVQDFSKTLNIAVIGKVSSGKSSLINALLKLSRKKAIANVGAEAGVTTKLKILRLDERVRLIDSPGLDDVRAENSEITREFLKHIDVGILVVTGASDASQKRYLDDLRSHCDSVFVVLNKIDEWDRLDPSALEKVINQWKEALQIEKIYPVCAFGYDPGTRPDIPLDIRGVYGLREDIENFLGSKGKDLLLARHMGEKKPYVISIITAALVAVAGQAFIPGSAAYITATQAAAIVSLYYLYTGEILSQKSALAILPAFAAEAAGTSLFLFVTSFLPPTGVVNIAAAGVAMSITLAILATINHILANGAKLEQEELLKSKFRTYRKQAETALKELALTDVKVLPSWKAIIEKFL